MRWKIGNVSILFGRICSIYLTSICRSQIFCMRECIRGIKFLFPVNLSRSFKDVYKTNDSIVTFMHIKYAKALSSLDDKNVIEFICGTYSA